MKNVKQIALIAMMTLVFACGLTNAQSDTGTGKNAPAPDVQPAVQLADATEQFKTSSRELISLQENEVQEAATKLEELRTLVAEGLVARVELESSEQRLAGLRAQLEATHKQVADYDRMVAERQEQERLAKTQAAVRTSAAFKPVAKTYGTYSTTATILRYQGVGAWSLSGLSGVRSFFSTTFGRALPTSAVGQSATHNQLRYDHRNAVDVALHPDSTEGQTLINYLKVQGIPFLAFRGAIPGVATGPHIHIGTPSHRLS